MTTAKRNGTRHFFLSRGTRWFALLLLCSAFLQGAIDKSMDFPSAVAEMKHFGLAPSAPLAVAVIVLEFGASLMILLGRGRWLAALALAAFTFAATFLANRFWELEPPARIVAANGFFEHLGLVGAFILVAWNDLAERRTRLFADNPASGSGKTIRRE
jgi:uncharacterized membrane protein YphA (DoxX/SURF4 family)